MNNIELIMDGFYNYLKKERGFSYHTITAYRNDLGRFMTSLPKSLFEFSQIDREMIYDFLSDEFEFLRRIYQGGPSYFHVTSHQLNFNQVVSSVF